jgi:hypothetical protein
LTLTLLHLELWIDYKVIGVDRAISRRDGFRSTNRRFDLPAEN